MSYFILNQLRCCRSRFHLKNGYAVAPAQQTPVRFHGDSSQNGRNGGGDDDNDSLLHIRGKKKSHSLGQAVILVQQGVEIQELPIILRKYGQNEINAFCSNETQFKTKANTHPTFYFTGNDLNENNSTSNNKSTCDIEKPIDSDKDDTNVVINPITDSDTILRILEKCETGDNVLQVIKSVPVNELDPEILIFALERMFHIEPMQKLKIYETSNEQYQQLVDAFCRSCDTTKLLNILQQLQTMLFMNQTTDQICAEILSRSADGCLNVMEISEAIHRFVDCHRFDGAEKFWSALSDIDRDINEDNIKFLFEILPKLKVSRRMVVGILDRCIVDVFPMLKSDAVADIMDAMKECRYGHSTRILKTISRWLNVNIHAVNETILERILHCMNILNYSDNDIENAIERYMKAKATKIKAQTLIVEILKHSNEFRIINSHILNGCSEFFIKNANHIDPGYIRNIVCPFGELHFQPFSTSKFWQTIESYLNANFNKIPTIHIIDILMATVYLQLYPVNFIDRVFNRYFMHLLHSTVPIDKLPIVREKLKLLDAAMTLECREYHGPLLPRHIVGNHLKIDNRIKRIINDNEDIITLVAGDKTSFTTTTVPQQLPYSTIYAIDILFHPAGWNLLLNYNTLRDRNVFVAALIHLPDHYDSTGKYLIGEQQMRIRHLRIIGLKVVSLQYTVLSKLSMHRKELHDYFKEQMRKALPAFETNVE